ncbi:MAG: hypothetical protein IT289_03205 [Oligoflexia bacterium]|nr:hypothetical protein [Oligoflexia bacterium]
MGIHSGNVVLRTSLFFMICLGFAAAGLAKDLPPAKPCASLLADLEQEVTEEWISEQKGALAKEEPGTRKMREAAQTLGVSAVATSKRVLTQHNDKYTHEIKRGVVTDQKRSGRCWIFAGCNVERSRLIAEGKVGSQFEFSYAYLHFFNMLEKSNRFLTGIFKKLSETKDPVELRSLIKVEKALGDGGWYEYFQYLVAKYGLVPKEVMPETPSSSSTALLLSELQRYLGEVSAQILDAYSDARAEKRDLSDTEIRRLKAMKSQAMSNVFKILVTHLGLPPEQFEFRTEGKPETKNGVEVKTTTTKTYTPHEFAKEFVGFNPDDYVVITTTPLLDENGHYTVTDSAIGVSKDSRYDLKFLNLPVERLEQLIVESINLGQPLWFAADVQKEVDAKTGIMHPEILDTSTVYGFKQDPESQMTQAHRVFLRLTSPNHAMVISGYDQPVPGGPVIKFKVENSWGDQSGDKGVFHMYREWLRRNLFVIVVPKALLSNDEIKRLKDPPKVLDEEVEYF